VGPAPVALIGGALVWRLLDEEQYLARHLAATKLTSAKCAGDWRPACGKATMYAAKAPRERDIGK